MSATVRFPYPVTKGSASPAETSQIIEILSIDTSIKLGGEQAYADVRPWKIAGENTEAPYTCVVIEFSATGIVSTIGNGTTEMIGLYGQIDLINAPVTAADRKRTLLGIIGVNLGFTMPQIPIVQQAGPASDLVGFSQAFNNIAAYDRLSIGGVFGNIALPEGMDTLTVVARPIRHKDFLG